MNYYFNHDYYIIIIMMGRGSHRDYLPNLRFLLLHFPIWHSSLIHHEIHSGMMTTVIYVKLDQVYCAWLNRWVVKREFFQLAQLGLKGWWIISDTGWCVMVLGQYMAILVGTWWYWVSISWYCLVLSGTQGQHGAFMPVYFKQSGGLVRCYWWHTQ